MDHEYLQNVMGSPYVSEGAFSRLKARGAQAQQAGSAMLGRGIQDPTVTKVKSLWDGMMKSFRPIINDWRTQVSPMLQNQKLSGQADRIKRLLDDLAITLGPILGQLIQPPRRYDDPTNIGGSPSFPQRTTGKLTEMVEEGWWDAAKRDIGLNKKLGSNDPGQILDGYKNKLLSIYQAFLKDVKKMTGLSKDQIYPTLAKVVPQVKKVAGTMAELQTAPDSSAKPPVQKPQAEPPPIPQQQPYSGPQPPVIPQQQPPPIPQQKPAEQPPKQQTTPSAPADKGAASIPSGGGQEEQFGKADLLRITKRVCEIVINAVKEDASHIGRFFAGRDEDAEGDGKYSQPLPTSYGEPSLVSEADNVPNPDPSEKEGEDVPERPGEFVYNFHSKKRKYPSGKFVMPIVPVDKKLSEPIQLDVGPRVVTAWWVNQGPSNKIGYLVQGQGKSTEGILMEFFDHEVSSRSGATTPGHQNQFSISKVLQKANPYGENPMTPDKTPNSDINKLIAQVNKKQEDLIRALGAVTIRKSMEFKPKPKDAESYLVNTKDGSLIPLKRDANGKTYQDTANAKSQKELSALLASGNDAEREKWRAILDHYDYFKLYPEMLEAAKRPEEREEFQKAVFQLEASGTAKDIAIDLVRNAWDTIRKATKLSTTDIKAEQLGAVAKPDQFSAFNDGVQALTSMGWKPKDNPAEHAKKIWAQMVMQKNPSDISTEEFVAAVTKGKAPSASAAPPTAPPAPTTPAPAAPSTPSEPPKEPKKGEETEYKPKPEDIEGWDSNGTVSINTNGKQMLIAKFNVPNLPENWRQVLAQKGYFDQFQDVVGKPASAPAAQPKVSGPASAPAPQAKVTTTPSQTTPKPVEPKPTDQPQQPEQPKAPAAVGGQQFGSLKIKGNNIEWISPKTGEIHLVGGDELEKFAKKQPKFVQALKAQPDLYAKFKEKYEKAAAAQAAKPKKKNLDELNEEMVNPFQSENMLL